MAFDPATAYLADSEPPAKTGLPTKEKFDPSTAVLDEEADLGLGGTLIEGAKSAGRAIGATVNAYSGDNQGIVDKAEAQQQAPKDYRLDKFYGDFADRTAALGDDPGVLETIGAGAGAIWDNPAGAGLAVVEQLPNAVPALAGGFAGMKAGAAGGAALGTVVAPGPGTAVGGAVGGVVGGLAGMFLGNAAIETGHKAMGMADDGAVTDAERSQAISEGAIKGGVITGVDALTLGAGGKLASDLQRTTSSAMESATRKVLLDRGVDVADNAAVLAARGNPEITTAVRAAQESARQVTDKFGKRLAVGGTLLGMETVGEGVGEYLGELAATGEGNVPDAVLESLLSLGQSGAETAWNMARKSPSQGLWVQPQPSASNPAPAPIAAPNPEDGVLSRSVLAALPAPAPRLGLPAPESVLYADEQGTVSDQGPARNVDREYRPTGRERDPRTFGAGMDQQTERGAVPGREGDYIPVSRFASQQVLASNTIDGQLAPEPRGLPAAQRLLADGRADAGFIETNAAGESRQAKTGNVPPKDYVPQGGRGMDQQTPVGKKYTGMPAARKALRESANPAAMEVVKVGKKQFEVRAKPVDGGASESVTAPSAVQFAAGQRWQHQGRTYNVNKVQADGRASVSTPSGSQAFVIRPEQAAAEGWTQDTESNGSPLSANGTPVTAQPAQKKARKVDRERDSVAHAVIRLGGITTNYRQDTTGEAKGNTNIPGVGSLWSDKTGTSIDDMASLLDQHGYIPQGEMASDGGVSWLQAALGDQLAGRKEHFAPGSKRQEEQALKTEANRLEVQAAQEEAGGDFDSAETVVSDLLDDADLLEIRAAAATKHAAELDVIFGDSPNETVASTQSADRPTEGAQRTEAGESGSAGAGQRPQGSQPDVRAESPAEETPSLELTTQTEASAAADAAAQTASDKATAAAQKKADDAKKKADNLAAIKAANTKASETFELGQNADDNLSGQSGMFDSSLSLSESGGKPATEPAKAKTKIEDAGDQLKFNKKGMFRNGGLKWSDIKDDNEAMKVKLSAKEKIWARPDWEEIIAAQPEGVRDGFSLVAHLVKQVYDGIPKQSPGKSDEALQTYIAAVGELRDAAETLLSDNAKIKPLVAALAAKASRRLGTGGSLSIIDMIKGDADSAQPLFSALFPEQASGTRFTRGTPANDKANALDKAVKKMQWGADSAVEAMKAIKKGWPAKQEAWQKQGYAVFDNSANEVKASHYEGGSGVSTTLKLGSSTIEWLDKQAELGVARQAAAARLEQLNGKHLVMNKRKNILGAFDTNEEAEDFARKQTVRKKVEVDSEANEADENWWSRAGDERRPGNANVTEGEFKEAFGFRGVNFGKWVNQQERQQHLNAAFDAFHDLAAVLDIPPKAISLNGMLGMAFGAQGGGSAAAHFVAGVNEINLTKTAGAGALAHEWAHGLDHYFGVKAGLGRDGAPWASTLGSRRKLPDGVEIRPEVAQAFKSVIAQMRAIEETPEQAAQAALTRLDRAKMDIAITTQPMREQLAGNAEALAALDKVVAGDIGEYVTLPPAKGKRKPVGAVAANIKIVFDALGYSNEKMAKDGSSLMGVYFAKSEVGGVARSRIKHTDFYKKSQARDGKSGNYWATQWEMFARGFESWVMDKLAGQDKHNNYLVRPGKNDRGVTDENFPYPAGEERKAFNQAIDVLTAELKASAPDESGNVALFSRGATGATLTTLGRGDVEQITARLVTEAAVARRFVFSSWEELPQAIKDRAAAQGAKPGEIKAVHWQGKTYLVDRRFTDAGDVERTIFHEYYAHYGLRQQYGKDLHRKLLRTWAKVGGTKGVRAMAAEQGFNIDHYIEGAKQDKELTEAQRRALVMDELLAHMAESTGSLKRLIQEWYGAVREWLRGNGWAELAKLNAADLAFMLRGARQAALRADGGSVSGQPLFQRVESANQISTVAFKRWFGESKVVDKQGAPKILYHGTGEDFTSFDQGRSGSSTRHSTAPLGIFMTGDRDTAQAYADKASDGMPGYARVMQLYAAIRNPYLMSVAESQAIDSPGEAVAFRAKLEREGYDGINLKGTDTWIAFSNTQMKSATDNNGEFDEWSGDIRFRRSARDLFDRAAGPAPLDRNDPFAAENRRLREDDKTLWAKAKKVFARQFAPGGLLPDAVFAEKITRDSEFQAVEFDVRHLSGGLNQAVKADFGVDLDNLTPEQMKPLAEALTGKVDPSIPEATRVAIVAMRQYIDSLSGEYLSILQKQVELNMEGADQALIDKITGNLGAYVNRSYQAFDDPKWFKTVPTETVNAARTYLAKGYMEQGETPAEAARLADVTVNEMLKNGTAYDSMGGFIAESKLGAKDLTVLIKRKDIAPEIRALLGEYMDPRLNFAKSATKMGRMVWNQRFLDRVLEFGMGTLFFKGKDRPADATTQIAGEQSESYAPLNGLWTFPEVAQSFQDALGKEQMSDLYRTVVRLNGMVKYGKTILSPTTAMRNWQSAMFFSLANGHFDMSQMKKSWSAFREQVTQNATGDDLAYLRKLKQLGVVYDTPYAGEMMALMDDARMDELLSSKSGTGLKWLRKANQFAQGFYSFGDDFWKIIGYENEKASLIAAGIPEAQAETMAAERIRNTYPTYSMIGKAVQWLRRFPLAGTFVSFPSEIIRTTVNMMKLTAADLKSDNPGIRAIGRKRAAGMAMVSAGFYALSAMTAAALGVGDDEEEALRDLAAPWSKNSTFLYAGRDADGKLRYFDMSFLDPYGYWKRPLTAMMRDQPWEQAAVSGISDMLSPFFGADITAGAIFEVMANKKPTGGQVYNENAGSVDQLQDISNHMRKALQPGFVSNGERLWLAGSDARREGSGQPYDMRDEVVSLLGWRSATLDTQTGLYYRSFDFTDALADAKKTLTRTLRSSNDVSEGDIRESKQAANAQYQKAFTEMGRLISSAGTAGMSHGEIVQTLKLSGVSQRNILALISGRVPPIDIGVHAQSKAVKQARVMRDGEHAAEIARRFRLAREQ